MYINRLYAEDANLRTQLGRIQHDIASGYCVYRDSRKRMIVIPTGSVQKLNSYILQSSCRGGHSAHIHGYQHIIRTFSVCYQRIPKYTQHTTMYAPTHNTKFTQRTAMRYQLHTYVLLNQRHYIQMIISGSKELRRSQPLQNETSQDHKK